MKKRNLLFTVIVFLCIFSSISNAQVPTWIWAKSATGTSNDNANSIAVDASGNIYVAGYFASSSLTFGTTTLTNAGGNDIFLAKYNSGGTLLWAIRAGGTGDDNANSVAIDVSGNVFVTGSFSSSSLTFGATTLTNAGTSDVFLVKYNSSGTALWAKSAGGTITDAAKSVAIDASGNAFIAGYFNSPSIIFGSTTLTSAGPDFVFVAKYDASGNVIWAKRAGGSQYDDEANSVTVDASGNTYVAGDFQSSTITFGSYSLTNAGYDNIFLAKYDDNGNVLWLKGAGGTNADLATSVVVNDSGKIYLTGNFQSSNITFGSYTLTNAGSDDIFLTKYDASGNVLWAKRAGGTNIDYATSIAVDTSGNIYLAGYFSSSNIAFGSTTLTNAGYANVFIADYNSSGNVQWAKSAGGTSYDEAYSVAAASRSVYLAGYFSSTHITFGTTTLTNTGGYDIFLAKNIEQLTADAGTNKTIICGATAQLDNVSTNYTGIGTLSYNWSPTSGLNSNTIINPTVTVTITTKYFVTVTTSDGYNAIDSVTVFVNPLTASAGTNKTIICGGSAQLDNVTTNYTGAGILTYNWSPSAGLNSNTILNPIATVTSNTTYFVTVSTPNGCEATSSVNVTVNSLIADAGTDKTIICGGWAQLDNVTSNYTGAGILTYNWSPSTGLNSNSIINPISSAITTTKYHVTVTTPNGCTAIDSVTVHVNLFTADAGTDKTITCGDTVQLDSVTSNYTGAGVLTYSWSPTTGLNSTTILNPMSSAINTTKYYVTVATPNGCNAIDSVTVHVNPFTTDAGTNKIINCGGSVQLDSVTTNYTGSGTLTYNWAPITGLNFTNIPNPTSTVVSNIKYYVTVTTPNGCNAIDSVTVNVTSFTADAGFDKTIICGDTVQLDSVKSNYSGSGTLTYNWFPTIGLNSNTIINPVATVTSNTKYFVTITTPNNCTALDSVTVNVNPLMIYVSNASTTCGTPVMINTTNNYSGSGILTYSWLPTTGLSASNVPDPTVNPGASSTYTVTLTTPNGCVATNQAAITLNPLPTEQICYVEFDTLTFNNNITWTTNLSANIDSVHVYYEVSPGIWTRLVSLPSSQSSFVDVGSTPATQTYTYRISVIDTCGIETDSSTSHTSVTFSGSYNVGLNTYNFSWTPYQGLTVANYTVYGIDAFGAITMVGSVAGTVYTYDYINPYSGFIDYFVGFYTASCPNIGLHLVRSNYLLSTITNISETTSVYNKVSFYPNPVTDILQIQTSLQIKDVQITDITGRLLFTTNSKTIDCSSFANGVYFIKVSTNDGIAIKKFVKE